VRLRPTLRFFFGDAAVQAQSIGDDDYATYDGDAVDNAATPAPASGDGEPQANGAGSGAGTTIIGGGDSGTALHKFSRVSGFLGMGALVAAVGLVVVAAAVYRKHRKLVLKTMTATPAATAAAPRESAADDGNIAVQSSRPAKSAKKKKLRRTMVVAGVTVSESVPGSVA
jgi:hypothetical protein